MSLMINLLIAKNDQMVKDLQEARKRTKESAESAMAKVKEEILAEILTLETTMLTVYRRFFTVHKEVVHL